MWCVIYSDGVRVNQDFSASECLSCGDNKAVLNRQELYRKGVTTLMRFFHSDKDLTPVERSLTFDFGMKLRIASYEDLGDAFCTDFLCSEKLEERTEKIGYAKVNVYADGDGNRVVELTIDVPVLDSGDREYDSWHSLYLTRGMQAGHADG